MTHQTPNAAIAEQPPRRATRTRVVGTAFVVLIFLIVVAVVSFRGVATDRIAADQNLFHLPVVRQFTDQWPRPDLTNYASATAPGYHLLMAAVSRYVSPDLAVLRVAGGVFGVAFVGLLAWAASIRSAWLALPAAMSVYVLSSTIWLLPENAAWALVTLALLLALRANGVALYAGSAITLAALVFVRQTHVWTFATLTAASYSLSRYAGAGLGRGSATVEQARPSEDPLPNPSPEYRERGPTRRLAVFTVIAILPAALVLAWLVFLWHGLTPPAFQPNAAIDLPLATRTGGLATGAPAMMLAVLGLFGVPLLPWLWPNVGKKRLMHLALLGSIVGLLLGLIPQSVYDTNNRSGLWNAVRLLPTIAGRSPLFVGLAVAGGAVAVLSLAALRGRSRWVLATALLGFTAVQATNPSLWQRYYEPFALLWLALAAAECVGVRSSRPSRTIGMTLLVAMQLAATVYTLGRGG